MKYYILVENIRNPILIELKRSSINRKYVVFMRSSLEKFLPKKLFNKLLKNGLYSTTVAKHSLLDNPFGLQRLVACLYQCISGLDVHHILKNPFQNSIDELLPVAQDEHKILDNLPIESGKAESYKTQSEQIKQSKNTLAKNYDLVLKILKLRGL